MQSLALRATLLATTLALAACGGTSTTARGRAVSGRTDTGAGVSLDFSSGWIDEPPKGRPFTKIYSNAERQLEVRVADAPSSGLAIATHGDQMKRGLAVDGSVEESAATTIDGHPAFRVVVKKTTATGSGIVVGVTIQRSSDRITTLYVSSTGDEKADHRSEIDALLATVKVT
jgi:hypothetical protein